MSGKYIVQINTALCKGQACAICQYVCAQDVWPLQETRPETCTGCMRCAFLCPEMAIDVARADGPRSNRSGAA